MGRGGLDVKGCWSFLLATKVLVFAVLFMWGAVEAENGRLGGRFGFEGARLPWLVFAPALVAGMGMLDGRSDLYMMLSTPKASDSGDWGGI